MTNALFAWPGVLVCALIVIAAICRINLVRPRTHRLLYPAMYLLLGVFALGVLLDLVIHRELRWYVAVGCAGVALHFFESWSRWRHAAPPETLRSKP